MKVIPAIDVISGKVVRLHKGDYSTMKIYADSVAEQARKFAEAGFSRIHIVDLDGAKSGKFDNLPHISECIESIDCEIQTGGGIRDLEGIDILENAGLHYFISNSLAVKAPDTWNQAILKYQKRCILGLDLLNGKIAYSGWEKYSSMSIQQFLLPMISAGMDTILSTDISKDGTLSGPNFDLYVELMKQFPSLKIIASGGVSGIDDLKRLKDLGLWGVVVGKAYYEGKLSLEEMLSIHSGDL